MARKVLAFGTFDILHPGHEHFLREAKSHGDELHVVIARDDTVKEIKGNHPKNHERNRMMSVYDLPFVDAVYLGNIEDKYDIIEQIKPDMIFLGYDQKAFTEELAEEMKKRGLKVKILRSENPLRPEIYKSSKMKR